MTASRAYCTQQQQVKRRAAEGGVSGVGLGAGAASSNKCATAASPPVTFALVSARRSALQIKCLAVSVVT